MTVVPRQISRGKFTKSLARTYTIVQQHAVELVEDEGDWIQNGGELSGWRGLRIVL